MTLQPGTSEGLEPATGVGTARVQERQKASFSIPP